MPFQLTREERRIVVKIVTVYSLFGGLWIYLSDSVLGWLVRDPDIITRIATYKGLLFIAVTAALLYFLIGRYLIERKNLEKHIRLVEFAMARISDAFYLIDADGTFLDVNDAACRMRGYRREEFLAKRVSDIDPDFPPEAWAPHWDELKRSGSLTFEAVHSCKNGQAIDVEVTANYFRYMDTEYNCAVVRDISERKAAERELKQSEKELRSLMDLMPVGIAWSNNKGNIEYANHNFVEKFGYTLADVPTVEEWFLKAYPDASYREKLTSVWFASISEFHASGTEVPSFDVKVTCRDGSVRDMIINTLISHNRTLVIFTDVTERETLREELIKKQKLESIGLLAGGIAHDFNNILTAILGNISYAGLLIDKDHKAASLLLQAEKGAKRAAELAHQLLTFARGGEPITSSVAVARIIEDSLELVLHGSNVRSRVEIEDGVQNIKADSGQISQVFNNLIINAVQAMPDGGIISIRVSNFRIGQINNPYAVPVGAYVRIILDDEGRGIPSENLKNIFDPYFTTKSGGSGLGLASVQSIISKHGGHISVSSSIGSGTTFEILLPTSTEPAGEEVPSAGTALSGMAVEFGAGASLLVMDDEEMIREMASAMLEELGYRVTSCASGEEAVELYKVNYEAGTPFSAAIMDLTIPGGMGGRDAARAILDFDPGAQLIVSSGYSNDPIMSDYRHYGFAAVVVKPYGVAEIANVLSSLISSGKSAE
ncbi:MAG: PAS domain S-box protein [Geobacter sp.]|nr:PAS domain S-box protein [Geobacter sp.]